MKWGWVEPVFGHQEPDSVFVSNMAISFLVTTGFEVCFIDLSSVFTVPQDSNWSLGLLHIGSGLGVSGILHSTLGFNGNKCRAYGLVYRDVALHVRGPGFDSCDCRLFSSRDLFELVP